jgi:hypothetical protein
VYNTTHFFIHLTPRLQVETQVIHGAEFLQDVLKAKWQWYNGITHTFLVLHTISKICYLRPCYGLIIFTSWHRMTMEVWTYESRNTRQNWKTNLLIYCFVYAIRDNNNIVLSIRKQFTLQINNIYVMVSILCRSKYVQTVIAMNACNHNYCL